jgi:DNA-binding NarL/FixJ family response regulator
MPDCQQARVSGAKCIRVVVVDDHPLMRQGTRAILEAALDVDVVGEAGRGEDALELARVAQPDVILLDIRLRGMSGVEVARALRHDHPSVRIVVLTAYNYEQYVRALFAIGVDGYLLKSASAAELLAALHAVVRGEQVVSQEIAEHASGVVLHSGIAANPTLTNRECEVLVLLARGARNKEIAMSLGIETSTVETHISNAIAKLGARSRTEAITRAVQRGVIVLDDSGST